MATRTPIEAEVPRTLEEADFRPRGRVFPSPTRWRDQFLYQLLPDRFSDGQEATRPLFDRQRIEQFQAPDRAAWMAAGMKFNGGTLRGIASKLDYLRGLGVTTLWINPPWKQRCDLQTYHGYGIQNFLDIDPRFGTRQDLRDLVDAAHDLGMYVILDVIFNHSGNNWFYRDELTGEARESLQFRATPPHGIHGWRDRAGRSMPTVEGLEDGVWPREFQNPDWYSRCGSIGRWETHCWEDPLHPEVEFRRGDFFDLKDMNLVNEETLRALARVYQYWIALSDCDGFRVDAVKHVSKMESRRFCRMVREYAQMIGKDRFLLVGEITDAQMAIDYIEAHGLNLDAVLDIAGTPNNLAAMVKGHADPIQFFVCYAEWEAGGLQRRVGDYYVSVLDDHDMSCRANKARFAAGNAVGTRDLQSAHVVGVQLTIPAIPAMYYGTEQGFDGNEGYHDYSVEPRRHGEDRYIRESMFGGPFGAFGTRACHFFDPNHPTYVRIAAIARLRNADDRVGRALRRGTLIPRETSSEERPFAWPSRGELVAWSLLLFDCEVTMALNTQALESRGAKVTIDRHLHPEGTFLRVLYRGDWSERQLRQPPTDELLPTRREPDGRVTVRVELAPASMVILTRA